MRADMAKVIVERPRLGSRMHGKPKATAGRCSDCAGMRGRCAKG